MKQRSILLVLVSACSALLVSACGTREPKDFGGRWTPVNRFAEEPTAIPLYGSYVYQVSPADGSLKKMLERWAADTGVTVQYRLANDYTLHAAVASVRTTDAAHAMLQVESAFAGQRVKITLEDSVIIVSSD